MALWIERIPSTDNDSTIVHARSVLMSEGGVPEEDFGSLDPKNYLTYYLGRDDESTVALARLKQGERGMLLPGSYSDAIIDPFVIAHPNQDPDNRLRQEIGRALINKIVLDLSRAGLADHVVVLSSLPDVDTFESLHFHRSTAEITTSPEGREYRVMRRFLATDQAE